MRGCRGACPPAEDEVQGCISRVGSPTSAYTGEMDEGERLFGILKTRDLKYLYRVVEGGGEEGKKKEGGPHAWQIFPSPLPLSEVDIEDLCPRL